MKENQEYIRKRRPINFTLPDLENDEEDETFDYQNFNPMPSTSRSLPSGICKKKIVYDEKSSSDNESDEETESNDAKKSIENEPVKEANLNESAKNLTIEENDEEKEDSTTNVWNEQINEKFSEFKSLKAKWEDDMIKAHTILYFEQKQEMMQHFMVNWSSDKSEKLLTFIDDTFQHLKRHLAIRGISSINPNTLPHFSIRQSSSNHE